MFVFSQAIGSHRFLVVTPERLLVVDSGGGGVGSTATVKGNHHLTEVCVSLMSKAFAICVMHMCMCAAIVDQSVV